MYLMLGGTGHILFSGRSAGCGETLLLLERRFVKLLFASGDVLRSSRSGSLRRLCSLFGGRSKNSFLVQSGVSAGCGETRLSLLFVSGGRAASFFSGDLRSSRSAGFGRLRRLYSLSLFGGRFFLDVVQSSSSLLVNYLVSRVEENDVVVLVVLR